ncbi:hypothetical protein SFRURICE_015949 [Spodoptera frugiperda]|nr:hypothetical protein SFRURICE_015949 [Spodoptera frugiperda]
MILSALSKARERERESQTLTGQKPPRTYSFKSEPRSSGESHVSTKDGRDAIDFRSGLKPVQCSYVSITGQDCLVGRVQSNKGSRVRFPRRAKYCWGFFGYSKYFSVVARSLEMCIVYGNSLTPYYMGLITQMVKVGVHCIAALRAVMCTSAYPSGDKRRDQKYCLVDRVVATATTEQGVLGSIPGPGKVLLGLWISENFSVAPRSLELCPVYGNRLTPHYIGLITQMVKSGYLYNVHPMYTMS